MSLRTRCKQLWQHWVVTNYLLGKATPCGGGGSARELEQQKEETMTTNANQCLTDPEIAMGGAKAVKPV